MTREFSEGWFCGGRLDVKLVNVLWVEETVRAFGRVREELPEGDKVRVCGVWGRNPGGTMTVVGTASALYGRGVSDACPSKGGT